MDQLMTAVQGYDARAWLEFGIITVILTLMMGRFIQVILFAFIALVVDVFLPVVYDMVQTRSAEGAGSVASDILNSLSADWQALVIKYGLYLVAIAVLYILKSLFIRR